MARADHLLIAVLLALTACRAPGATSKAAPDLSDLAGTDLILPVSPPAGYQLGDIDMSLSPADQITVVNATYTSVGSGNAPVFVCTASAVSELELCGVAAADWSTAISGEGGGFAQVAPAGTGGFDADDWLSLVFARPGG